MSKAAVHFIVLAMALEDIAQAKPTKVTPARRKRR